ncbi:MAG TPA: glycosyltransferase family 4 protein [Pyrinomonadaceae bacterium]|nr:glycosyltransferase family 4 protein [Pyrinomonadaceae bacterium]
MRILQICSAREIGGGERHLADLANTLAQRGHQVFAFLSPSSPVRATLSSVPAENIIELPLRNSLNLATAMKLSRFVRAQNIEIVHAHVARDYPLAALASGRSKARLVLTRHVLFPLNRIHKLTLRPTSRVIAVSHAVAESLRSQSIFDGNKIVTIHNGIDLAKFETADPSRAARKLRVGTAGHLAPIKGHEDFVRAAALVLQNRPDVEFVIAGEDKLQSGENRTALEKLIRELRVSDPVKLIGWIDDMPQFLSTLDLFVSAARSEPFGLAIVEAMAAGVPVVATASEGARETIDEEKTGRLVGVGDVAALARVIEELIDDEAERGRLAQNARAVARDQFSLTRMVERTEEVYESTAPA